MVIPVRQVAAPEYALKRPPERALDCQRARRRVVGVDLEAQPAASTSVGSFRKNTVTVCSDS